MNYARNYNLLNSKFKELLFPTLLTSIAGNFAMLIDAFFISLFMGSTFLSVVQTMEPFVCFINTVYWLIGFGGSILCNLAKAEFDKKKSNELFSVSIIGILLISIIITILSFIFQDMIIQFLCHSPNMKQYFAQYFNLYLVGIVFECYKIVLAYFIRNDDFVQLQFQTFMLSNIVNITFDIVFMKILNYGIGGAALATSLGSIVGAIYISVYFFKSSRTLKIIKVKSSKIFGYLVDICRTGFSSASITLYIMLKFLVLNALIAGILGEIGLVALNMCYNATFLVEIFILGTTQSILPITTVYYKEKDYSGVDYVIKKSVKLVMGFGIFFNALLCIFPQIVLFIFNMHNPEHVPIAMNAIRIVSFSFLSFAINYLYIFYAQSIENDRLANMISLLQGLVFPVVFATVLSHIWGSNGFWFALVLSELATVAVTFIYSRWIIRKSNGEYTGFFLNRKNAEGEVFEFTIEGNVEDAVNISKEVQEFFSDNELSAMIGMAVEDMIIYILESNDKVDLIDSVIRNDEDSILISIKYSGKAINLLAEDNPESNISILKKLSDNIDYSEILGLNNVVITIKK